MGAGSVLCLAGNYFDYNISQTTDEADNLALTMDFLMVGQDIQDAMNAEGERLEHKIPQGGAEERLDCTEKAQ